MFSWLLVVEEEEQMVVEVELVRFFIRQVIF